MDALRDGVKEAVEALGSGFLAHRENEALRTKLREGALRADSYYHQLRRMVYRLIFLAVAEDRDLLLLPETSADIKQLYTDHYSLRRLRTMSAVLRGGPHPDLHRQLRLLFVLVREGYPGLGLPGLGSFLFSDRSTPDLDNLELANQHLLAALRALSFTVEGRVRRAVDFRNLDSEELGSIYQSLLELHPEVNLGAATFVLNQGAGSERKTTGSHYTPTSLVESLLDTALEPVVADRLARAKRGSGEWGVGSWEEGIAQLGRGEDGGRVVSGFDRVAEGDGPGGGVLSTDEDFPQRGTLRDHLTDSAGVEFDSSQHRGGLRPGAPERVHPLSSDRPGFAEGTGDTSDPLSPRDPDDRADNRTDPDALRRSGENAAGVDSQVAGVGNREWEVGNREWGVGNREWGVGNRDVASDSLLPTPYSLEETAILSIKVLDAACGSGHMLIGAGRRLARHLARIRKGEDEPSPEALRAAMRDVVRHCLYGVDLNDMAVELCKVALWMESLEPGKPLSFLDAHIQCGNSLIGVTPGLDISEIPDDAFQPVTGDDKATATGLRRRNKKEREGKQFSLLSDSAAGVTQEELDRWRAAQIAKLESAAEEAVAQVREKEIAYEAYLVSEKYELAKQQLDLWTAAFFWSIPAGNAERMLAPTQNAWEHVRAGQRLDAALEQQVHEIAARHQFFHWALQYPDVFQRENDGFDVILMNPPWERIKLQEKEWFAARSPDIASAPNAAVRKRMITALQAEDPALWQAFQDDVRIAESESHFIRNSGKYPLCGRGDVNTYAVFAELVRQVLSPAGRVGIIVPTGIATDDTTKFYFQDVMETGALASLYDFENRHKLFPAVDSRMKFCLLTLRSEAEGTGKAAEFVYFAMDVDDLRDDERRFSLTVDEIELLNPYTRTCPIFRSKRDAELNKRIYESSVWLGEEGVGVAFEPKIDMTDEVSSFLPAHRCF